MSGSFGRAVVALVSGATFGIGLTLSGVVDPARVRGFLDVFGSWYPALVFVLGGAVIVAAIGVAATRRMARPVLDDAFHVPTATAIDARLPLGSAIFGIGWGDRRLLSRSGSRGALTRDLAGRGVRHRHGDRHGRA